MATDPIRLDEIGNAEEFVAALRRLKEHSGFTLRQLEERAAARGDVLARSTVADTLRRRTLPRPALVVALVRACGDGDRLVEWTRAYERVVAAAVLESGTTTEPEPAPEEPAAVTDSPPSARPRPRAYLPVVAAVLVVGGVLFALSSGDDQPGNAPAEEVLSLDREGNWARIRPVSAPGLCVTEGFERTGRYGAEVAVQQSCNAPGPRTLLQPVGDDLAHIKWEHPVDKVLGCLTILDEGQAAGLVEPQNRCSTDQERQVFRIERVKGSDGFRLRRAHTTQCLGIANGDMSPGAEVVPLPCSDDPDQRFLIDLLSPAGEG